VCVCLHERSFACVCVIASSLINGKKQQLNVYVSLSSKPRVSEDGSSREVFAYKNIRIHTRLIFTSKCVFFSVFCIYLGFRFEKGQVWRNSEQ